MSHEPIFKLKFRPDKTVQAIDYIASIWPNVSHYYVCKVLYFADKAHCLDWGRTVTGDRYVAMPNGPVPSETYNLLRGAAYDKQLAAENLRSRVKMMRDGNRIHFQSVGAKDFPALSDSDKEALAGAVKLCRGRSFTDLTEFSHKELPWAAAVEREEDSNAPPMDLSLWFDEAQREEAGDYLREHARNGVA